MIPSQLGGGYDHQMFFFEAKPALRRWRLSLLWNVCNVFHSWDHQIHHILRKGTPSSQLQWLSWCYQPKFFTKMTRRVSRVWPRGWFMWKGWGVFLQVFWDLEMFTTFSQFKNSSWSSSLRWRCQGVFLRWPQLGAGNSQNLAMVNGDNVGELNHFWRTTKLVTELAFYNHPFQTTGPTG